MAQTECDHVDLRCCVLCRMVDHHHILLGQLKLAGLLEVDDLLCLYHYALYLRLTVDSGYHPRFDLQGL